MHLHKHKTKSMKIRKAIFPALSILIVLIVCVNQSVKSQSGSAKNKITDTIVNVYAGSYCKGNYVWGGAMNLAWNDLSKNIIKEKIALKTNDKNAVGIINKLNKPPFTINDLDGKSYYIKSGYGQKTLDIINKESRKKFPHKSFADLTGPLNDSDIIAYASFLKQVYFPIPFTVNETNFLGQKVKGFYAGNEDERDNVKIIDYENDDHFIISLQLKDSSDQLILAKGYDMTNPAIVVKAINDNMSEYWRSMSHRDDFEAPKINLDQHRDYVELIQKQFANKGFEKYVIGEMFENIKFTMDEKGAKAENEAEIRPVAMSISLEPQPKPKHLVLDKPFWVVMQRKDSKNPYFLLGVNNTELMEKVK